MKVRSKMIFQGKVIRLDLEDVRLPNGVEQTFEVVHHPGGAAVVAIDDHGNVCLLKQFRYVIGEWLWELPAGKIDENEDPGKTAERELEEEAGVKAHRLQSLGDMLSSPGVFTERIYFYLASKLESSTLQPEEHEIFEVHWVPFQQALQWAKNGEIKDAKTIIGLQRAAYLLESDPL